MTELPKIVVDRVRAGQLAPTASGSSHPDADLLTAFVEQTLLPAERDGILRHLAACNDCREVVAVALPPTAPAASTVPVESEPVHATERSAKAEKSWLNALAWPSLRWAALAAGVVVAGSLLLVRHGNTPAPVPSNQQAAISAPPAPVPQVAPSMDHVATFAPEDKAKTRSKSLSTKLKTDQGAEAPDRPMPGILIADARRKTETGRADKLSPARPPALDSPAASPMNETVEVSAAAAGTDSAPATASNLIARNEAPAVEKAKPAPPEIAAQQIATQESVATEQVKASSPRASGSARSAAVSGAFVQKKEASAKDALTPNFKLRIAAGVLQRSVDNGVNWQVSLHSDHPLLCYATLNFEVWAGGEAGTLFHSTDGGLTWVALQPVVKAQSLSYDVVTIKVQGPQVLLVSTSNHETWTTEDGGQTWDKK